jgi:DNA-binding GntR family transcriptional regulator
MNDAAYSIIRMKLLSGEFELGGRIREDLLAKEISMSRTPIREAINRLVSDGIIVKKSQQGLYLIDPLPEQIEDHIEIRISLEKLSIQKCIERSTDEDIEAICNSLKEFEKALEQKDFVECNKIDSKFHSMIAQFSNNARLIRLLEEFSAFFLLVRIKEKKSDPEIKNKATLKEHRSITEAIKKRDVLAAQKAMEINIRSMRKNLFNKTS